MATSTYPATGGMVDNTSAAKFIPEIWSDEVIAAYEKSLVLAPLTKKIAMQGKKGDTIHIPKPTRGVASAKAENTAVTIQNATESEVLVTINKHFEYSRMIEDITEVQALASLRQFYTGDAGYALGKQVDDDLFTLGKSFGDGDGSNFITSATFYNDASTGTTAYAADTIVPADVFADSFLRDMVQKLDDADAPMDGRFLVIPPSMRNAIMGIDRYVSSDFVNGQGVVNGKIGELYGIDIYVSTNCPTLETASENGATAGGIIRGALMGHKDTMVLAEQQGVRSQTQYKQEFLGTLYTADRLYGTQVLRPETGFMLAVNG
jgi:N4-gp56 family major capsid protein|tara:strand:- start:540 stop:1499 length:960 start_codon:yes stop_codon:yes gene_type:complete